MQYQVVVLSGDTAFARMLELEFSNLQVSVMATVELRDEDGAEVLILDLDSASAPPSDQYRKMIGFSRRPAMTSPDARSCSMILRRPFRMSLLRREIFAQLEHRAADETVPFRTSPPEKRRIVLNAQERKLICESQEISLTAGEFALVECLLAHRGEPVSRETLEQAIGASGKGNETDVYVCYLRRKTDSLPNGRLIRTVRGKGYRIL